MTDIAAEMSTILINAAKAELHGTGCVPRPQAYMFAEDTPIGFVTCRRFYTGSDSITAIGDLGVLPSVMKMTRLLILWENSDLEVALDRATGPFPMALMLLDASFKGHTLHRYPFEPVPTGETADGVPTLRLDWKRPLRAKNPSLPDPITRLLRVWRELRDDDIQKTVIALQQSGYELDWFERIR